MSHSHINIIAALSEETRAIGKDNELLWHLPGDLQRFKELTMGHPIIMGSTTYESIGRALSGRTNIVITNDPLYKVEGATVCHSVDEAITKAQALDHDNVFVIGGGSIYAQTLELADRLYLTLVADDAAGDVFFPKYENQGFVETKREDCAENGLQYAYVTYERITCPSETKY